LGRQSLEAAIVRVSSSFDHLVGERVDRCDAALQIMALEHVDGAGVEVVSALRGVLEADPEVIFAAVASGAPLTAAAEASGATVG